MKGLQKVLRNANIAYQEDDGVLLWGVKFKGYKQPNRKGYENKIVRKAKRMIDLDMIKYARLK